MSKRLYILHKNGAKSHYIGLEYLVKQYGIQVKHREFSIVGKFFKSIFKGKLALFLKQWTNLGFLISLFFTRNRKIVVGIAPYDSKLKSLLPLLRRHQVYYHTSWTCWDGSFQPKNPKGTAILKTWKTFLEGCCQHIFTVSEKSKEELLQQYQLSNTEISSVAHSLHPAFKVKPDHDRKSNSFLYYGRLVAEKGLLEVCNYFATHQEGTLTIIGKGPMETDIRRFTEAYSNIVLQSYTSNREELVAILQQHQFLVLNSKRTRKWEELFGLVIIEGMSQGVIPVATSHSGPKEIISEKTGYLFEEGALTEALDTVLDEGFDPKKSEACRTEAMNYFPEEIQHRWNPILNSQ